MLGPQFDLYRSTSGQHTYQVVSAKPAEYQSRYSNPGNPEYNDYGSMNILGPRPGSEAPVMQVGNKHEPQGRMFSQLDKPRPPIVDTLFVHSDAASMVPTMLGVAQNYMHQRHGRAGDLVPSHDLSEHSSKVVKHLQDAGAVDKKYSNAVTNSITREEHPVATTTMEWVQGEKVSSEERRAGFQTAKRALRGNRPMKKAGEQFHQPELPLD